MDGKSPHLEYLFPIFQYKGFLGQSCPYNKGRDCNGKSEPCHCEKTKSPKTYFNCRCIGTEQDTYKCCVQ